MFRRGVNPGQWRLFQRAVKPDAPRSLAFEPENLAAAFAVDTPARFAVRKDYAGEDALVASRNIEMAGLPWVLVRKVDRAEALGPVDTRLNTILGVFIAAIVIVTVTIIAVWRHGTSVRMTEAAEKFRISSERFENIGKFMRVVTNSAPNAIVAVDGTTTYTFANDPAAKEGGITAQEMLGKTMASVIGPVKAKVYADINREVLANFETYENQQLEDSRDRAGAAQVHTFEGDGEDVQVIKSDHVPLRGDRDHPPGVLMVLSDITELTTERRRNEDMTRQLINTMVSVVDRRDPFSAHHSNRTAEVARCLATEMELPEIDVKTVDIAGSLMSLGKVFIPREVLAKGEDEMTAEEQAIVANAPVVSADVLGGVPFEGPVVETIRQLGERWDGSGPLGLTAR